MHFRPLEDEFNNEEDASMVQEFFKKQPSFFEPEIPTCFICEKQFTQLKNLQRHSRDQHNLKKGDFRYPDAQKQYLCRFEAKRLVW